jgi:hypothetical protein
MGTPVKLVNKPPLPAAARGPSFDPSRYATQESVDCLTKKVDQMMEMMGELLSLHKAAPPSLPPPSSLPSITPAVDMVRAVYESCTLAMSDKAEYEEKESRAVVIGMTEKSDLAQGLISDQKLVADLVKYCDSEKVQKAFSDQLIKHKRHPTDRPPGKRPLKIECPSKEIRDLLLSGIRGKTGRPTPFTGTLAFIRKDLTPTQLKMERDARDEARQRNVEAGQIVCGVRDFSLYHYRTPRPFPSTYGRARDTNTNPSADLVRSGSAPPSSGSVSTDATVLSSASGASAISDATTVHPPSNHINTNRRR